MNERKPHWTVRSSPIGHGPLLERAIDALRNEGVATINVWACTPMEGAFEWLETHGYVEHPDYPRGFKKYVT